MSEDDDLQNNQLLGKIKNHLSYYYEPVQDPREAEFHYSTREIHQQLLNIYPNELFLTEDLVATWLNDAGFKFYDFGEMKFEWLLKKA